MFIPLRKTSLHSFAGFGVALVLLTSCSGATTPSAPLSLSPLLSTSLLPSATITTTSTITPTATSTLLPTSTPSGILPEPRGTPARAWNDLPIMPQALAGEAGENFYAFTTEASLEAIAAYYLQVMTLLGWSFLGANQDEQIALLLVFAQDEHVVSVAIFDVTPYLVMLVYYQNADVVFAQE